MVHSLEDLKLGKLKGVKRLKLACGLKSFPLEILSLADTLEILDLSGNHLSELPPEIVQLKKLKIIFFANNDFKEFPKVLAALPALSMIGFKSNQIKVVPENAFPLSLQWLILTDNQIDKLPKSIGECKLLQKCALAGNRIEELPVEMSNCRNLGLLRISANNLKVIPKWLFELPQLSWVAFSGNPATYKTQQETNLASFDWSDFEIQELLGEGASGLISKAKWKSRNKEVAVKIFKGDVTSDGLPKDEMEASILAGTHEGMIPVLGRIKNHPENKDGLIMELIDKSFVNLGNPPSLDTCTRDVFEEKAGFNKDEILKIAKRIASVCVHLHSKGINHGDLYAHNILVNTEADCLLGDFGASSFYDLNSVEAPLIQRVEVKAYGCLLEDLLSISESLGDVSTNKWKELIEACTEQEVKTRPSFLEISEKLTEF